MGMRAQSTGQWAASRGGESSLYLSYSRPNSGVFKHCIGFAQGICIVRPARPVPGCPIIEEVMSGLPVVFGGGKV